MNPTPQAIAAIQAYVATIGGYTANSDAQVVVAANNPTVANTSAIPGFQAQATIPVPYTITQLIGLLSSGSIVNLKLFPGLTQLMQDIDANNTANVAVAVEFLAAAGDILSSEATAVNAVLAATELDPSWPALVGWARATIGRNLDINDSAIARAS